MPRPVKCACGRYIKPLGWANHRKNCEAYQAGLREFAEKAGLAPKPTAAPAPGVPASRGDTLPPADADGPSLDDINGARDLLRLGPLKAGS